MLRSNPVLECQFLRSVLFSKDWPEISGKEFVFWGKSNVGKSSLLNALMQKKGFAKVSKTPGRTQSINFYQAQKGIRYVDLPGYGYACVPKNLQNIWHQHVVDYLLTRSNLCVVFLLIDSRRDVHFQDLQVIDFLQRSFVPVKCIYTKIDRIISAQRKILSLKESKTDCFEVSATTREGVLELRSYILNHSFQKTSL
ncbi:MULTISPECIES: ribosome biogenesis GTP-binding protein YihA/YsxC [Holospora]|uniref:Probable GTP-binding protein EngB n=2 Tax=Holospora TaxID=44747 RepID=A0A061JGZ7_9PROT|nr:MULTISPECIES: ribosome biogenesis GTP-binding protein YihA/YsxC [Holospora]ETZ05436.1 putative GTP-binding protein EngB [Holospora undulata HU1]GAJ46383.1 putative GTP-binding protein EngB [Holospora elegans E1]